MAGLTVLPASISKLGIKNETVFGTDQGAPYRGLLVTGFEPVLAGDFSPYKKISGVKGNFDLNQSGEVYEISFSVCGGESGTTMAGLGDIMAMIYDADLVVGTGPYVHVFTVQNIAAKKSWTLVHDDAAGNIDKYVGFVVNEVVLTVDKGTGVITVEVSGFAQKNLPVASGDTINFANLTTWSPVNSKITFAGAQVDMYNVLTLTWGLGAAPFDTINDTPAPTQITGVTNDLALGLEGFYSKAGTPDSDTIRAFFTTHGLQNGAIQITLGPILASDSLVVDIPQFKVSEETGKSLEQDGTLPQSVEIQSVNKGLPAGNHQATINSDVPTDFTII